MGRVSSLTLTDSGNYYTFGPTVTISAPVVDSAFIGKIDSSDKKFGPSSLHHDSQDMTILGTLTDSIGPLSDGFVSQSFWLYLDSQQTSTLIWSEKFRIFLDDDGYVSFACRVDSADKSVGQTDNVQLRTSNWIPQKQQWHFIKIETGGTNLKIAMDSSSMPPTPWVMNIDPGYYFYDSGTVIRAGYDENYTGPNFRINIGGQYVYDSNLNRSFVGNIDNYHFAYDSTKTSFNAYSTWVPDSAGSTYENVTPLIDQPFDYQQATASAYIDSATGEVNRLVIVDSGYGYTSAPTVTFSGGRSAAFDSQYDIGDDITQTLSSGVKVKGEVQRYQLDSAGDSSRYLYLAHVGADDGVFRTFVEGISINKTYPSGSVGLKMTAVNEINNISETEQNEEFTETYVDDFLDFSEDNPFGDPENQ
jgi:hypothetical protein